MIGTHHIQPMTYPGEVEDFLSRHDRDREVRQAITILEAKNC